jgi:uncharacterized membrane protein YgdD (TMEM256/DUF423 family)
MKNLFGILAAFYGMTAVMIGAFGAHALKDKLDAYQLQLFEKGVQYQFYHVVALLAVFLAGTRTDNKLLHIAGWLFSFGIILFSGSLYLLATRDLMGTNGLSSILGPITPLGGLCFILGWALLLISIAKL